MSIHALTRLLLVASIFVSPAWRARADGAATSADMERLGQARINWVKVIASLPPQNVFALAFRDKLRLSRLPAKDVAALSVTEQKQLDEYRADLRVALKSRQPTIQPSRSEALQATPRLLDPRWASVREKYGQQRTEFFRALLASKALDEGARQALAKLLQRSNPMWGSASLL
jgi:hypothetical protein